MPSESIHPIQAMLDGMSAAWQKERTATQMTLGAFISALEALDGNREILGVGDPISYRGYYSDLAFEPEESTAPVREVLAKARACMGEVFTGYKGGDFQMGKNTPLWLSEYGVASGLRIMELDATVEPIRLVTAMEDQ
jgi:hypothetical protein